MPRIAYVDGAYVPLREAAVSIEDRGLQFADSVYEVAVALNGRLFDWAGHLARLRRSLAELSIAEPMGPSALDLVARKLLAKNRAREAILYLQVTRGAARRDHGFPPNARPTLVMTVRPFDMSIRARQQATGIKVVTQPEQRWARRDIKTTSLLPNVLAKQAARQAGAFEAWMVEDGTITEGASTNAWIVESDGTLVTHPADHNILAGVMRGTLIRLACADGFKVEERAFSLQQASAAAEAFITSTTAPCLGVVSVNGRPVGKGAVGPVTLRLGRLLWGEIERQTGYRPATIG
jgi:D-alanine transaminase